MTQNLHIKELISYLKNENISIDFEEFSFQAESHPDYPSLLAFSDTLNFFNLQHIVGKVAIEDIDQLPDSFVALIEEEDRLPHLYHITKEGQQFRYNKEKKSMIADKSQIAQRWNGVILAIEPSESTTSSKKILNPNVLFAVFALFGLFFTYLFSHSLAAVFFGAISFAGLYFSIEALKTELGIESKISQAFCNSIPNADCAKVINSDKNTWLKNIKISDVSFWFFSSQITALLAFSISNNIQLYFSYMLISLVLAVPLTLYSLYFQYRIEKVWCALCLSIISITYLQLITLLFIKPGFSVNVPFFALVIFIFSLIAALIYLLKPTFIQLKNVKESYIKQLRFSRNYEVFKNTLVQSKSVVFTNESIILGNPNAPKSIHIITSPFCGYCKKVHKILENVLKRNYNDVSISIRFNFYAATNDNTKNILLRLTEIYKQKGDLNFINALNDWFENRNYEKWFNTYGLPENTLSLQYLLEEITKENIDNNINFTPDIFLNEYNFPQQYDRDNLEYFILDWLEDDELYDTGKKNDVYAHDNSLL